MVSFGIVFQLVLENAPEDEKRQVFSLLRDLDLPITLSQLGVEPVPENICIITKRILDGNSGMEAEPFALTEERVYNALILADKEGKAF